MGKQEENTMKKIFEIVQTRDFKPFIKKVLTWLEDVHLLKVYSNKSKWDKIKTSTLRALIHKNSTTRVLTHIQRFWGTIEENEGIKWG